MKSNLLKGTLLAGCLALFMCSCGTREGDETGQVECPEHEGFGKAIQISAEEALGMMMVNPDTLTNDTIVGGFFSWETINELLNNPEVNGLGYYIVRAPARDDGSERGYMIMMAGVSMRESEGGTEITRESDWYVPNKWCPPNCTPVN